MTSISKDQSTGLLAYIWLHNTMTTMMMNFILIPTMFPK